MNKITSPKKLSPDMEEYKNLEEFAKMITAHSPNGYEYYVGDTYFDYGQDWKWTTILCRDRGYQAINPREWEEIINKERNFNEIMLDFFTDEYCPDKKKGD